MSGWIEIIATKPDGKVKRYLINRDDVVGIISWQWKVNDREGVSTGVYFRYRGSLSQVVIKADCYKELKRRLQTAEPKILEVEESV